MNVIEIHNLTKDYGQGHGIFDVNIEIAPGTVYGYIGTNGSGKTTTIRHIMGFIRPEQGAVTVNGRDAWRYAADLKHDMSYIPGEIEFPRFPTGTDFLKYQAEYLGVSDFSYMNELIERLQLDPSASLRRMSKGMKQKTAIVAALMGDKKLLILDEPTTGLDPLMREEFLDLIKEEKKRGKTILMSSHIFEEIESVCDEAAMIHCGRIVDRVYVAKIRHPEKKTFIVTFQNKKLKSQEISVLSSELPQFFASLKDSPVQAIHEKRTTLEERFKKAVEKEGEM